MSDDRPIGSPRSRLTLEQWLSRHGGPVRGARLPAAVTPAEAVDATALVAPIRAADAALHTCVEAIRKLRAELADCRSVHATNASDLST